MYRYRYMLWYWYHEDKKKKNQHNDEDAPELLDGEARDHVRVGHVVVLLRELVRLALQPARRERTTSEIVELRSHRKKFRQR